MDQRDLLKLLRDAPPPEALDAIESEGGYVPSSDADVSEWGKWSRTVWERALDAIIYA
jgi:hypothetical protein